MKVFVFLYSISFGFLPFDAVYLQEGFQKIDNTAANVYEIEIEPEIIIVNLFYIGGKYTSQFEKAGKYFSPIMDTFDFETGLKYKFDEYTIQTGFTHRCIHPVMSINSDARMIYGGRDKFYIKVGNK